MLQKHPEPFLTLPNESFANMDIREEEALKRLLHPYFDHLPESTLERQAPNQFYITQRTLNSPKAGMTESGRWRLDGTDLFLE